MDVTFLNKPLYFFIRLWHEHAFLSGKQGFRKQRALESTFISFSQRPQVWNGLQTNHSEIRTPCLGGVISEVSPQQSHIWLNEKKKGRQKLFIWSISWENFWEVSAPQKSRTVCFLRLTSCNSFVEYGKLARYIIFLPTFGKVIATELGRQVKLNADKVPAVPVHLYSHLQSSTINWAATKARGYKHARTSMTSTSHDQDKRGGCSTASSGRRNWGGKKERKSRGHCHRALLRCLAPWTS